jgi:hypothetical protein
MPDEPPTMVAWMPCLSRTGGLYWTPVTLPRIEQIADEVRYRRPAGLAAVPNGYRGPARYVAGADTPTAQPAKRPRGRPRRSY